MKVITGSTTRTTALTTKSTTTTSRTTTTKSTTVTTRTTAPKVTTSKSTTTTTQTTTKITEAPKATLSVQSAVVSDVKKVNGGYQQRVTVKISNVSSVRFNESRRFTLQLSTYASKALCLKGGAAVNGTTGTSIPFTFSDPLNGGSTETITFLIETSSLLKSVSCA